MAERLRGRALDVLLQFRWYDAPQWHDYAEPAARILGYELGEGAAYCSVKTADGSNYIVDFRQQLQVAQQNPGGSHD